MEENQIEKPIIKRTKEMPKKQKIIISSAVLVILIIIGAIATPILLKKSNKKKQELGTVNQELSNIENKIKKLEKQEKENATPVEKSMTVDKKIEIYKKKIEQYKKEKRDNDAFQMTMEFLAYVRDNNLPTYGLKTIESLDTAKLSNKQKMDFYELAAMIYFSSRYDNKANQYTKKFEQIKKLEDTKNPKK